MNARKVLASLFVVGLPAALVAAGCSSTVGSGGGGASCSSTSKCSADPAPTSQEVQACQMAQSDSKCGSAFSSLLNCSFSNQTCDSSGHTMQNTACNSQATAYANCLTGGGNDGGPGGDSSSDTSNAMDTGTHADGGGMDTGMGVDTGGGMDTSVDSPQPPPGCYANAVFTPLAWAPPTALHQGLCTTPQLMAFQTSLNTAGPFTSGSTTCDACLMTDVGATTHGPVLTVGGTPTSGNYGGCMADIDGMTGAGSCGNTFDNEQQCIVFECAGAAPGSTRCSDFNMTPDPITKACISAAFGPGGQCVGDSASASCSAEINPGGAAAACGPTFINLITIWCGP
jgi:hypothetical protein